MKTVRFLIFRALLLITFLAAYLYLLYGQEPERGVPIVRNHAWNDLVSQMNPMTDDSPHETLGKEIFLIQKFLKEHQYEVSVDVYDVVVFRAIDQARARLQKADKDLETIRNELPTRNTKQRTGDEPWKGRPLSTAPNADSRSSRVRTLSDSKYLARASTSASIANSRREAVGTDD